MSRSKTMASPSSVEPERRLSPWRVLLGLLIVAGLGTVTVFGAKQWVAAQPRGPYRPWFAAYVDVTAKPTFAFDQLGATSSSDVVLSFIVASPADSCTPSWGAEYSMQEATASLDLERRIARLQQEGGSVAISFGGQRNQELAVPCTDPAALYAAYQSVVDHYHVNTIDLDIEGADLTNADAGSRRAAVIAKLQQARRKDGKQLAVWVTLPVTTQGLSLGGTDTIAQLLAADVDLAGINIMTMDYGNSLSGGQTMLSGSESALIQTERQLGVLYQQAGIHLNDGTLWAKLAATPMIGQNDDTNEVFTLADAKGLDKFAAAHKLGRMSMWSANRDITCGGNYVDIKVASSSCSGVTESPGSFAAALSDGFNGRMALGAGFVTTADAASGAAQAADNPATSPYQIWSPTGAYLQGTKVVWHRNVYQAKWWTQGDVPDNPVLQTWQTPWQLIGPVLPGETPIPQATLPEGTYPDWSGTAVYNTGDRVLFSGVPYQAKWWNQGQSPAAATSSPDSSPWAPLTQAQIDAIEHPVSS